MFNKKWYVYEINNKENNSVYYGVTDDLERRKHEHIYSLENNRHSNNKLQKIYNNSILESNKLFEFKIKMIFDMKGAAENHENFLIQENPYLKDILNIQKKKQMPSHLSLTLSYTFYKALIKNAIRIGVTKNMFMKKSLNYLYNHSSIIEKYKVKNNKSERNKPRTYYLTEEGVSKVQKLSQKTGLTKRKLANIAVEKYVEYLNKIIN
jgi:hypothetical protein